MSRGTEAPPPAGLRGRLEAIAADLGLSLAGPATDRLLHYLDGLQRWNAIYNLTSVRDPQAMLTLHLADCLAVVAPLRRQLGADTPARLLDVGSGAGLPGIVVAVLSPRVDVTCVDAVGKKAAFVRQMAGELGLPNLHAHHARIEQLDALPFDIITSRAFASLADFTALTRHLLAPAGVWMAMKGKRPDDEIAALPPDVEVFHVEQIQVPDLDAGRCIVWMRPARASG